MAVIAGGLIDARVMHARHAPRQHQLLHHVYYVAVPLHELQILNDFQFLSYNRRNLFQLRDRDYGFDPAQSLAAWARAALRQYSDFQPAEILLITMPRSFGHSFNPVSFWCYFDGARQLRAVLAEVNNTFGQRHAYLCMKPDGGMIMPDDWLETNKVFHVSPFFDITGHYRFRFDIRVDKIGIWIDYVDGDQKLLSTAMTGARRDLSDRTLWQAFFRNPFVTLKTIGLIHLHALYLLFKSIRYRRPGPLPQQEISK